MDKVAIYKYEIYKEAQQKSYPWYRRADDDWGEEMVAPFLEDDEDYGWPEGRSKEEKIWKDSIEYAKNHPLNGKAQEEEDYSNKYFGTHSKHHDKIMTTIGLGLPLAAGIGVGFATKRVKPALKTSAYSLIPSVLLADFAAEKRDSKNRNKLGMKYPDWDNQDKIKKDTLEYLKGKYKKSNTEERDNMDKVSAYKEEICKVAATKGGWGSDGDMSKIPGTGAWVKTKNKKKAEIIKKASVLTTEQREELPMGVYGLPEEGKYPMPDAAHVKNAWARRHFVKDPEKRHLLETRIKRRAKELGVHLNY